MQIDEDVEHKVREIYSAVVGRDTQELDAKLRGLAADGVETVTTALNYTMYVCGYVVLDLMGNGPSEEGLTELAQDTKEGTQDWIDVGTPEQIAALLRAAAKMDFAPEVPREDLLGHLCVIGGFLLSRYRHEGQRWFEFLDDAWNVADQF